jgi:hypothetical protein
VGFSTRRWRAFDGAPFESSAAEFGTEGTAIFAVKPVEPRPEADLVPAVQAQVPRPVETSGGGAAGWTC